MFARKSVGDDALKDLRDQLAQNSLCLMPLLFRRIFQISRKCVLSDLPSTQLQTMILLDRAAEPFCMTQLAEELCVSPQQFTKVARALEERGYVRREQSRENRRMVLLDLTENGRAVLESLLCDARARLAGTLEEYAEEELRTLLQATEILRTHLGKDRMEDNE